MNTDNAPVQAALGAIAERLEALKKIAELDRELPFAFGRAIAPFKAWQMASYRRLESVGLRLQADMLVRLGYMGRGDPVLDITARINAAGGFLEDLRRQLQADPAILTEQLQRERRMASDRKRVAVVHGRNHKAKSGMFAFLRTLGLHPVDWDDAIKQTGKGAPQHREILDALFQTTQAVVVLLTPDEEASMIPALRTDPRDHETKRQARPNVWLEAGMALGVNPDRTILVRFGHQDEPSDIHGLDYIGFDGSAPTRDRLQERLTNVGCDVKGGSSDRLSSGQADIDAALESQPAMTAPKTAPRNPEAPGPPANLSESAGELLLEAVKDQHATIMHSWSMTGLAIATNERNFILDSNPRTEARWEAAVRELAQLGLIQDRGHKGEVFNVTDKGFAIADRLKK